MSPPSEGVGVVSILSHREVQSVLTVVLLMMVGLGMIFPIAPLFARSFDVSLAAVGAFISAFGVARLLVDVAGGLIVDRFGERAVSVGGLIVMAAAALMTGLSETFLGATAMWAAGGAGSAVVFAALYSYMLKVVPKDQMARAFGIFYGTFNVGIIAGGPLGGLIAHRFGLRAPFIVYAGILLAGAFVYLMTIRSSPRGRAEANEHEVEAGSVRNRFKLLLRSRGFLAACAGNLAYLWMIAAIFETLVPLLGRERLGMSTSGIGVVFAVATAAELVVLYPAGKWADRRGRKPVLIPALAALAAMTVVIGWSTGPVSLALLLGVLGLASGVAGVPPAAMLSDVSSDRTSGAAVGMFRFCGDLGFVLGPIVAGTAAAGLGFGAAFAITAVPTMLALGVVVRAPETLPTTAG